MTNRDSSNAIFIRLLGTVEVSCQGKKMVPFLPPKGVALLAYLCSTPGVPQPRQKLAELFWPNLSAEAGRSNLRQVLLVLKRLLDGMMPDSCCLRSDRNTISFEPSSKQGTDLAKFLTPLPECPKAFSPDNCSICLTDLETMAQLYSAPFMDDFLLEDCLEFEGWMQVQRELLLQRALFLNEKISNCFEVQNDIDRALFFALRFHELALWSDEGLRRVIRLAALNGQRGFALSCYEAFSRTLKIELGVLPEPETRQLARRIQNGELHSVRQAVPSDPLPQKISLQNIERRQITFIYCQLVPIDEADPEDEFELFQGPLAHCKEIIRCQMGHILPHAKGEGLLACFGYPQAREDSALVAVRTTLALVNESFPGLMLRAGVHTGLVLCGVPPEQPGIIGRVSGLANGLSNLAGDKEVIISATTQQLVEGYFDSAELGTCLLSGELRRLSCFKVTRGSGAVHRLDLGEALTPLLGRNKEMTRLTELWSSISREEGKSLLLRGEPGIGKSLLVRTLQQALTAQHAQFFELRCSEEFYQSPFQPVINLLFTLCDFYPSDSLEKRFAKLAQTLRELDNDRATEAIPLIAELLSLPLASPYAATCLSSPLHREQTMTTLLGALHRLTEEAPVLLVIEDLHWIDPTTLEVLTKLLAQGTPGSVMLLLTARPEFQSPWAETLVPQLNIEPLSNEKIDRLIETRAPDISRVLRAEIVQRADGVPLFAEELSRASSQPGFSERSAVPASLQDLLAVRLELLAEDKGIAQLAATIGREFSPDLLAELAILDQPELLAVLFRLKSEGFLSMSTSTGWQFRHALIRDAAYLSQTRSDREVAHRRIAQILQRVFPEIASEHPELLAQHWSCAGEVEPAVTSWNEAGLLAQKHSAHQEALSHFNAGLALIPRVDAARQGPLELQLQIGLGASAYAVEGYASQRGSAAYNRAVELGEQDGQQTPFPALWGLWAGASSHSNWTHSLHLAKRLRRIARHSKDPLQIQQGNFALGNSEFWRGEFIHSRQHLQQAISIYTLEDHDTLVANYGENAYVTSGSYLSWSLCLLGLPEQALRVGEQAVTEARRAGHPFSLGYALTFHTVLQRMLRQPQACLEQAEETIALAKQHDFPLWLVGPTLKKGWAKMMLGDDTGLAEMQWSVDQVGSLMGSITLIFLETQADGLIQAGKLDEALVVIDKALEMGSTLDDHHIESELFRHKGLCLLGLSNGQSAAAEECFRKALKISRQQRALLLELRAAMALAQLMQRREKKQEAHSLLTEVYQKFTEGFDFPDLCAARELLITLAL